MFQSDSILGLPHPHPALSPNYLGGHVSPTSSLRGVTHQDYLNAAAQRLGELQASAAAGLTDPLNALEASRLAAASPSLRASLTRATRKRPLSASSYSVDDLSTLIRYSPTALHLLNGGSPSSSGSYGHISPAISPALVHSAHLQQLQAHIIRSASTSPFLSPQNSLQASFLHNSAMAAAAANAAAIQQATSSQAPGQTNPYFPFMNNGAGGGDAKNEPGSGKEGKEATAKGSPGEETCSNVVSSTMDDEDSREGLTPLTTVKVIQKTRS